MYNKISKTFEGVCKLTGDRSKFKAYYSEILFTGGVKGLKLMNAVNLHTNRTCLKNQDEHIGEYNFENCVFCRECELRIKMKNEGR